LQLYREHKFNPFSGLLVILVQLPLIFALYQVFLRGVRNDFSSLLYQGVTSPGTFNSLFFGVVDLTKPFLPLVILAALAQFWQAKTLPQPKKSDAKSFQAMFSKQMVYLGPVLTVAIFASFPSVIALYWFLTSILSVGQQYLVEKSIGKASNINKASEAGEASKASKASKAGEVSQ
ncbi:MAG: YidC/Oxa1 family membrane protein insertase, partial [Parcubacteria group bacterium]|nr:YidC/Oxa1 family membrane protein insertase [Parcubacteria group bacterium]